jgi:hypothetical protein
MAIEEKQRALEFTFVPDNIDGDLKYDITYNDRNEAFPLRISAGGNGMDYPLELVVEIVEFLTSKGVVKPQILSRTVETPGVKPVVLGRVPDGFEERSSLLTPPTIAKMEAAIPIPNNLTSNTDPLASFDITSPSGSIPTPQIVTKTEGGPPLPEIIKSASGDTVMRISAPIIPTIPPTETAPIAPSSEMTSRPVIRSRVTGGDPQSAEKEAAMLRASSGKGSGKTIRKAHRAEGE